MLVLFETPAGFALFKVLDEGKLKETDLASVFANVESAQKFITLKKFHKFRDTSEALEATTALLESSLSKPLTKFLKKNIVSKDLKEKLAVSDAKLGGLIKEKFDIKCVHDSAVVELMRGIRQHITQLVGSLTENDLNAMSLGLAHSLSRYKLKFSPDKVDTMIVQAIALLDDLDKELNTYSMRVREWYGWHFPELGKIITDNHVYAKVVKLMGNRNNAQSTDFSSLLTEELAKEVQNAAQISMGTDVGEEDIANIQELCDQVISITEYREQLYEYLKNRMNAIAPNLTLLVGELVGARLIAHAGSLLNLAKFPASTVQILGAEKALFRALKTKHQTPKYGLIYHSSLIGQAAPKHKGKIARVLAAKSTLAIRFDALGEGETINTTVGTEGRTKVEQRLKSLEGGQMRQLSKTGKPKQRNLEKYQKPTGITSYNPASDITAPMEIVNGKKEEKQDSSTQDKTEAPKDKKEKKHKKEKKDKKQKKEKKKRKKEAGDEEGSKKKQKT